MSPRSASDSSKKRLMLIRFTIQIRIVCKSARGTPRTPLTGTAPLGRAPRPDRRGDGRRPILCRYWPDILQCPARSWCTSTVASLSSLWTGLGIRSLHIRRMGNGLGDCADVHRPLPLPACPLFRCRICRSVMVLTAVSCSVPSASGRSRAVVPRS